MKKSDLVVGKHIVQMRNGYKCLLVYSGEGTVLEFVRDISNVSNLSSYRDDLIHNNNKDFDVIKVGLITFTSGIFEDIKWIWERKELKHNAENCFQNKDGVYIKIKKVENNKYIVDYINKYGEHVDISIIKWNDEDFVDFIPYTPIERPEFKDDDVVRCIEDHKNWGTDIKVGQLERIYRCDKVSGSNQYGCVIDYKNHNIIRVITKEHFDKWAIVDKNTLTVEELKNLGFNVEVKKVLTL